MYVIDTMHAYPGYETLRHNVNICCLPRKYVMNII